MIILAGRSASGKTTVAKELEKYGYHRLITYTTRNPREGEIDGVDYRFITTDEFLRGIDNGEFLEYESFKIADGTTVFYGSAYDDYINADDKTIVVLTPGGVENIKKHDDIKAFIAYIYASHKTIQTRLKLRGDNPEEAYRRIKADDEDFRGFQNKANKIIYNNLADNIDNVVTKVRNYYEQWLNSENGGE